MSFDRGLTFQRRGRNGKKRAPRACRDRSTGILQVEEQTWVLQEELFQSHNGAIKWRVVIVTWLINLTPLAHSFRIGESEVYINLNPTFGISICLATTVKATYRSQKYAVVATTNRFLKTETVKLCDWVKTSYNHSRPRLRKRTLLGCRLCR